MTICPHCDAKIGTLAIQTLDGHSVTGGWKCITLNCPKQLNGSSKATTATFWVSYAYAGGRMADFLASRNVFAARWVRQVRTVRTKGHAFHLNQHAEQLGDQVDGEDAPACVGGGVVHGFSFGSSDGGMAGSTTLCVGTVSRMLVGDGGWRPAWPGLTSSGQMDCQSSGRRILREISPPVIRSNIGASRINLSSGIPPLRQPCTEGGFTFKSFATAVVPPSRSIISLEFIGFRLKV
eukprot:gene18284-21877_t